MPPSEIQNHYDRRKIIGINQETVTDVSSTDYPGHYPGENHSWDKNIFEQNFSASSISYLALKASLTFTPARSNSITTNQI